jgi:hypothetical protein
MVGNARRSITSKLIPPVIEVSNFSDLSTQVPDGTVQSLRRRPVKPPKEAEPS